MILVVCGVSGAGKSTIGQLLAETLDCCFHDADDYHPEVNRRKMAAGRPLTDVDRAPWLAILSRMIHEKLAEGQDMVLACSALKQDYRDALGIDQRRVISVYLDGDESLIARRLSERQHAFMPGSLLQSQLATLEPPGDGIIVDIAPPPAQVVRQICSRLPALRRD